LTTPELKAKYIVTYLINNKQTRVIFLFPNTYTITIDIKNNIFSKLFQVLLAKNRIKEI